MRMRIRRNPLRKRLASTRIAPIKHIHLLSSARGRLLFRRHRRICSTQRDLRVLPPARSSSVGRGSRRRAELHADVHVLRLDRERLLDDEVVRRVGEGDVEAPEDAREDELGLLPGKGTTLQARRRQFVLEDSSEVHTTYDASTSAKAKRLPSSRLS